MFETGMRQLRLAVSLTTGRRINPANVARLVDDAVSTLRAFGLPGDDAQQLLDGPFADEGLRRDLQDRALQRTVQRTARVSDYYRRSLRELGVDPSSVNLDTLAAIPLTRKADLLREPTAFLASDTRPVLATRSTGSTGQPVTVWLSRYETELWPALAALAGVLRGEITEDDCMQVNISSRATAAVQQDVSVCRLSGAGCSVLGLIPAEESLAALLADPRPTLLATYPSYLASLVDTARARHLSPADFRLRRIDVGGEVLSTHLAGAAEETFGAEVTDSFAMTEVLPVSARTCRRGHLHHDLNTGYVEVLDLRTGRPAQPGALGTLVVTPYFPYRDCMPVLRYDTRDVVRQLASTPLGCELAAVPATSRVLGKADSLLTAASGPLTSRHLIDTLEDLPAAHHPVRYRIRHDAGQPVLQLSEPSLAGLRADTVAQQLAAAGIPLQVEGLPPGAAPQPLRSDLVETTFTGKDLEWTR